MRARAVALGVVVALSLAYPAFAAAATAARVRELATRAIDDPSALTELRGIDVVDDTPVDMSRLLSDTTPDELRSRLVTLSHGVIPGVPAAAPARNDARSILQGRRYRESSVPRPFKGVLDRVGRALKRILDPITRHIPGPSSVAWIVIGAIVMRRRSEASRQLATGW